MTETASENQASATGLRGVVRTLVTTVLLTLVVLAGAEATVRIEDLIRWGMPLLESSTSTADLAVSDRTGRHPGPGRTFQKWRINAVGTRGPEPDAQHADRRALVLGASETFGLYESPDHEYVRQLSDTLAANSCRADVLNAGFVGMSLPTVEQDYRLRLASLSPRVAIYYPTPPQYLDDAVPRAVTVDSSGGPPANRSIWHSRFRPRARDAIKSMVPRRLLDLLRQRETARSRNDFPTDSMFTTIPASRLTAFDHDLRVFVSTLRSRGVMPILVTHANAFIGTPPAGDDRLRGWERFYPRATGATLVAFDSAAAESVRSVAADSGVVVVDAWQDFRGVPGEAMFADFSHFTNAGAARMASLLRPAVARVLGCGAQRAGR